MSYSASISAQSVEAGEVGIAVGSRFRSWDDFDRAFKAYQQKHFSIYTLERTNPVGKNDRCPELRYKSASYWCVHHGGYEPKGKGHRPVTHTRDTDCKAYLYISRELREECLIIRQFDDNHKHLRNEELWKNYAQNRILSKDEQARVKQLQKDHTPSATIVRIMTH